jgi:hypothetical protein
MAIFVDQTEDALLQNLTSLNKKRKGLFGTVFGDHLIGRSPVTPVTPVTPAILP